VNVIAFDYRGFGDSTGYPTEEGLYTDARAMWDWTLEHGAHANRTTLMGHSLGTGVATHLASVLVGKKGRD
jgi:abhydrolase domain-containing protein 12